MQREVKDSTRKEKARLKDILERKIDALPQVLSSVMGLPSTYIHIRIYVYIYICIYVYIHINTFIYVFAYVYIIPSAGYLGAQNRCAATGKYKNVYIYVCVSTYVYMYTYTYEYVYIYIYILKDSTRKENAQLKDILERKIAALPQEYI